MIRALLTDIRTQTHIFHPSQRGKKKKEIEQKTIKKIALVSNVRTQTHTENILLR